jgi:hypothetical protein
MNLRLSAIVLAVVTAFATGCFAEPAPEPSPTPEPEAAQSALPAAEGDVAPAAKSVQLKCMEKCDVIKDAWKREDCYFACLCKPVVVNGVPMCEP